MKRKEPAKKISKDDLPRLMTNDEVAEYLQISPKTLRNWKSAGKGPPAIRYSGRATRYLPEDVYEWVKRQRV